MKSFSMTFLVLACVTLFSTASVAGGNEKHAKEMTPEQKAMMEAYTKAATPGKEHKMLLQDVGTWKTTVKEFDPSGKVTSETKGKAVLKSALGGRFIEEQMSGKMGGSKFEGRGFYGYDNVQKKFVSTWSDNMGTGIMMMTGVYDDATKTLTYSGSYMDPVSNQMKNMKLVETSTAKNRKIITFYDVKADGTSVKMMEMAYKR